MEEQEQERTPRPFTAVTGVSWLLALGLIVTGAMLAQELDRQNRRPTCALTARQKVQQAERFYPIPAEGKPLVRRKPILEPYAGQLGGQCINTELDRHCDGDLICLDGLCAKAPTQAEDDDWLAGVIEGGLQ